MTPRSNLLEAQDLMSQLRKKYTADERPVFVNAGGGFCWHFPQDEMPYHGPFPTLIAAMRDALEL